MATMIQAHIQNPKQQFPAHVVRALDEMRVKRMDALAEQQRAITESRPNADERQQIVALEGELSPEKRSAAKKLLRSYHDRVSAIEFKHDIPPLSPVDGGPEPRAADFWWARTQAFAGGGLRVENMTDGVHFFGRVSYNRDPLNLFSAGAWATFELQPERRPPSPSGRYSSAPHVELFGSINGWTNLKECPWHCDDKWSKCFRFLRQSAIQFVDDHGTWRLCGENTAWETEIFEEGRGVGVTKNLPGFLWMPYLEFALLRPDRSVLIDLEVRFDIQLEGDSFIGFSPGDNPAGSVLLRYFQWPCNPA